jgi:hypothetical protein
VLRERLGDKRPGPADRGSTLRPETSVASLTPAQVQGYFDSDAVRKTAQRADEGNPDRAEDAARAAT